MLNFFCSFNKKKHRINDLQCYTFDTKNIKVTNGNLQFMAVKETSLHTCVNENDTHNYIFCSTETVEAIYTLGY